MIAITDTKDAADSTCMHALDLFCAKSQLRPVILDIELALSSGVY
jgi:hypothetical protein